GGGRAGHTPRSPRRGVIYAKEGGVSRAVVVESAGPVIIRRPKYPVPGSRCAPIVAPHAGSVRRNGISCSADAGRCPVNADRAIRTENAIGRAHRRKVEPSIIDAHYARERTITPNAPAARRRHLAEYAKRGSGCGRRVTNYASHRGAAGYAEDRVA